MLKGVSTNNTSNQSNQGKTFRQAAAEGNIASLEHLFSPDIINKPGNPSQKTALHHAAANGKLEAVKWLVEHGAEIEAKDAEENTPLLLALINHHSLIADYFIDNASITSLPLQPSSSKKQPYRLPPLIFLASEVADNQTEAILANLPYLQSLGYKGFIVDFSEDVSLDELLQFSTFRSQTSLPGSKNDACRKRILKAVMDSPRLRYHPALSKSYMDYIAPSPHDRIKDAIAMSRKIADFAEQYDGGIICFLAFDEHPIASAILSATLTEQLQEKAKQIIFYSESTVESLMQTLQIGVLHDKSNYHDLNKNDPQERDRTFKKPIQQHLQRFSRNRYYDRSVSSSAVLTKLQSLFTQFSEFRNTIDSSIDAVLPVTDVADFKQKALLLSTTNISPVLCVSKDSVDPSQKGKLCLTLKDVESPENRKKILNC